MHERTLVVLGGGGHAAVVAESARTAGWSVAGFLDDDEGVTGADAIGLTRLGGIGDLASVLADAGPHARAHAAVGEATLRRRWTEQIGDALAPAIAHATAVVSPSARLEAGVFVGPGAIVNARAAIGRGVIVNSGAIIEHDCVIGRFTHIAPGAALGGESSVGASALVGTNATVLPGIRIGDRATLAAGAVAIADVADAATAVGNPARTLAAASTEAGL